MQGKRVEVAGKRIFYVERGAGLDLVLVHGNVGSHRWYERTMEVPGCRVLALDLPNFGASDPLGAEADLDRYADAVAGFIAALRLDRPVLVGHSLGGAVAISLAARYANTIRSIVLVDGAAPSGLATPEERYPAIERMSVDRAFLAKALAPVVPTLNDPAFFERLVDDASRMAKEAFVGNARALARFDYRGRCASFGGPVLVLWGRLDPIVREEMARETAAAFPRAKLEILEGVGHSVMAEDPARFVGLLRAFLADNGFAGA
jgi:pimeloyl-ACP methyl ester carboxylesterase